MMDGEVSKTTQPDGYHQVTEMPYMKRYVNFCKAISMWPRGDANFIRYWLVFFILIVVNCIILTSMYHKLLFSAGDVDGIAEVVDFMTVITSGMFRYLYARVIGKKYMEIVDFVHGNYVYESFSPGKKKNMERHIKISKYLVNGYIIVTNIWIAQMSFASLVQYEIKSRMTFENGTQKYPDLALNMPVNISLPTDKDYPAVSFVVHAMCYYSTTMIYVSTDAFWLAMLILTTGQFELISDSLRNIMDSLPESDEPDDAELKQIEGVLGVCLNQHHLIRQMVLKIESLMNPIVIVDFLHAVASITFILLDMTIAFYESDWMKVFNLLQYFLVSVIHMWVLDYFGNALSEKEREISTVVYSIPWYKYPKELKHQVLLMTLVSQNPRRLSGGKFFYISIEFFAQAMRTIFSYFMVFLQLRTASTVQTTNR